MKNIYFLTITQFTQIFYYYYYINVVYTLKIEKIEM